MKKMQKNAKVKYCGDDTELVKTWGKYFKVYHKEGKFIKVSSLKKPKFGLVAAIPCKQCELVTETDILEMRKEEAVSNFIDSCNGGELCDFCSLSEDCAGRYEGEPNKLPCTGLNEKWIEEHIDKDAIAEYLEGLK